MNDLNHLRYPIGRFAAQENYSSSKIDSMLANFAELPGQISALALKLDATGRLDQSYRPDGWTARQVIHHLADSHLNAYQRFKLTLTEENPTLRPYDEQAWANLPDNQHCYFVSQNILSGIHRRLVLTLADLTTEEWQRPCHHPTNDQVTKLSQLLAQYDWHGRHHLGHLQIVFTNANQ